MVSSCAVGMAGPCSRPFVCSLLLLLPGLQSLLLLSEPAKHSTAYHFWHDTSIVRMHSVQKVLMVCLFAHLQWFATLICNCSLHDQSFYLLRLTDATICHNN